MSGERLSVRFPRRIVAICVSEPMGLDSPRRMLSTPAMKVVATAPRPGVRTPRRPVAGRAVEREPVELFPCPKNLLEVGTANRSWISTRRSAAERLARAPVGRDRHLRLIGRIARHRTHRLELFRRQVF